MTQLGNDNVQNIKKQVGMKKSDHTQSDQIIQYLKETSKDREIRQDIEAQKYIANQLFELGVYDEAEKLCRRLLTRRPNDMEIQALHTKLRNVQVDDKPLTKFEKNRRIINRIAKSLDHKIVGLNQFKEELSSAVQRSLLNEQQLYPYKEVILISSPPSQGVKTTITEFFTQVHKYKLITAEGVEVIDLAQYSSGGTDILNMFLLDCYNAFSGSGQVTVFTNVDQCPQDLRLQMNQLVTDGRIKLDGRYVYQNGALQKVEGSLVSNSFDAIEAKDQFIIFQTHKSIEDGLNIFTSSSQRKITTQIVVEPLTEEESVRLFRRFFDDYIKRLERNLGLHIVVDWHSFTQIAYEKFVQDGSTGLTMFIDQIDRNINNYFVEHADQIHEQWEIAYREQQVLLENERMSIQLFATEDSSKSLEKIESEIKELIGLEEVKQSLDELKLYIENYSRRAERGLESNLIGLHFLFKGNPGTGKTTVARMIAEYLKAVGYLSEGHLVEVDRSGLVAEYVGHTAMKTMGKIEAAMGGVLFVDEAYALARGGENDFGREAIDTLVKAMEDHQGEFVVIFAGYPDEMDELLETNPGLQSRISQSFIFSDYSSDEMVRIAEIIAKSQGYVIDAPVKERLPDYFDQHQIKGRTDSGNGRLARNVVEEAITKQAVRIMQSENLPDEEHDILRLADFGLAAEVLFDLESELQTIVGLDHVKDMVRKLYRQEMINKRRKELNPAFIHEQSLNFIFTGNPGTGKTTIARIIADLFKSINLLKKGHLVEVSRSDLVAGYIGQTAIKTEQVFRRALGGVLFIDEAYSLAQGAENDFGIEAIDTLIKLIEDYRGTVAVILAGYENSMDQFLQTNEGLSSRFTRTLHFEDYSVEDLYEISLKIIEDKGFEISEIGNNELHTFLFDHYNKIEGNGRYVRNMVEELIRIQSDRVYMSGNIEVDGLLTITEEDINSFKSNETF